MWRLICQIHCVWRWLTMEIMAAWFVRMRQNAAACMATAPLADQTRSTQWVSPRQTATTQVSDIETANSFNEILNLNKIGTAGVPIALVLGHRTWKKNRPDSVGTVGNHGPQSTLFVLWIEKYCFLWFYPNLNLLTGI